MPLMNNFTANIPGFYGQGGGATNTGTDPVTSPFAGIGHGFGAPLGGGGYGPMGGKGGFFNVQPPSPQGGGAMPPPPPMQPIAQPWDNAPQGPVAGAVPQGDPQSQGMVSAMNDALMRQLSTGATGMQSKSPLVNANAPQVGASPRMSTPLIGA